MTSRRKAEGAASAASSIAIPKGATVAEIDRLEQAAYEAIENVQDPDEAEKLLREVTLAGDAARLMKVGADREQRWGGLRLRAERRYGELLGPAKEGRPQGNVTGSHVSVNERRAQSRAREVAAVSPDVFEEYVTETPKPSRNGLLRHGQPSSPPTKKKAKRLDPSEAVERLERRVKEVRNHGGDRPRWTFEDIEVVETVLKHPPKRRAKYAGKRLRELAPKRRSGHELASLQYRMMQLTSILESVDVADYDLADPDDVSEFHDDLIQLQMWMDRSLALASTRLDDVTLKRKIDKLRETNGRPEAEQRTALALADKLERRRLENRLA